METTKLFKLCSDRRRMDFDYNEIQRDRNNPITPKGLLLYPLKISAREGSSYTFKMNNDWFFKRKLQDGNHMAMEDIISQHHYGKVYDEKSGSFDDLAEVFCYEIAKNIINRKTGKQIIPIAEYKLAKYTDENNYNFLGCASKNVCKDKNDKLISMSEIMKWASGSGKSLDVYMSSIKRYCEIKSLKCDMESTRKGLIKQSYFCWKVANSDNHKNNIMYIISKNKNNELELSLSPLIDNGSAYELTTPYVDENSFFKRYSEVKNASFYEKQEDIDTFGKVKYDFPYYSRTHSAFTLETDKLLFDDVKLKSTSNDPSEDVSYAYEFALASEMLSDAALFEDIYEVENQFSVNQTIDEINEKYGDIKTIGEKYINWPPYLKDYIKITNTIKSQSLAYAVSYYYLYAAYTQCIAEIIDRNNPQEGFKEFFLQMTNIPLLESKEAYDEVFMEIAKMYGIHIDPEKLANIKFKREAEFKKAEQQQGNANT